MKRNIFYIILGIIFFISSCKKDYETDYMNFGADFVVTTSMTSLDNQLKISVETYGVTDPVVVTHLGGKNANGSALLPAQYTQDLGSIAISNDSGVLMIDESKLGPNVVGTTFNLKLLYNNASGDSLSKNISVKISNPFSITLPGTVVENDSTYMIKYNFSPSSTAVTSVAVETKKSKNGVYSTLLGTWDAKGEIPLKGNDYQKYDTVYFRITGTAAHSLVIERSVVVNVNSYSNIATATMRPEPDTLNRFYDLQKRLIIPDSLEVAKGDSVDIQYLRTDILGNYNIGLIAPKNAEFVKVTGTSDAIAKVYNEADKVRIPDTDFSSATKVLNNLDVDDVYIYRTRRGTNDYTFGVIKITDISKPNADPDKSSFTFEIKN